MSNYLKGLNKTELRYLNDKFDGVPLGSTAQNFVDALLERKVTDDDAKMALQERRKELEKAHPNYKEEVAGQKEEVILIRMRRANPTFEFRSYSFTKDHPFVLMSKPDAEALMSFERGFVQATPQEAREFYGSI